MNAQETPGDAYLRIADPGEASTMCWPNPTDPLGVGWALRYSDVIHRNERLIAASFIDAYQQLISLPQAARNRRIGQIKKEIR